jgi:AraC-like DNA-binding protein
MIKFKNKDRAKVMGKKHFFRLIYFYFLIPVTIMLISTFFIYNNYKSSFARELESNYISNLSALADDIDKALSEIQNTTFLLSLDNDFYDVFYSDNELTPLDGYKIQAVKNNLIKFKSTKDLIDSVYILHKSSSKVIDTNGSYNAEGFYSRVAKYDKYPQKSWFNFTNNFTSYQMLKPSVLEDSSNGVSYKRTVIPFVTSAIEGLKSPNLLVVNISINKLNSLINKYRFIDSSQIAIVSSDGTVFSSTDMHLANLMSSDGNLMPSIIKNYNNFFEYTIDGNKHLIINFHSDSAKFNDFIYVASVPYNDFYQKLSNIKLLAYLFIIFGVLGSLIISYFMSVKIYSPINNLVDILVKNDIEEQAANDNEIEYLNSQITKILSDNNFLRQDLSMVLPFASEQYLIKILTKDDFLLDDDIKDFISNDNLNFKYQYFCVAVTELNFSDKFYNSYNNDEYLTVRKGIAKLFDEIALKDYTSYALNIARNMIGIVINMADENDIDNILPNMRHMIDLFSYDADLLNIKIGVGRVFSGYIGMNQSYKEAMSALSSIPSSNDDKLKVYSDIMDYSNYQYSIRDENKLYNYLLTPHKQEAISFLNLLIEKNLQADLPQNVIRQFYLSLYNTMLRVAENKGLSLKELMGNEYMDLQSSIELLSINEINMYIRLIADRMLDITTGNGKIDINKVVEYIESNYQADIYLEQIAERFNTSAKYLSRLFKETLGVGFHEYLTTFRIEKAKNLLTDTDLSVGQIGEMIGFTNYSTFFRLFKKYEGVNPSQYRDSRKNGMDVS